MLVLLSLLVACNGDDIDDTSDTDLITDSAADTDTDDTDDTVGPELDAVDFSGTVTLTDRESDPDKPDYTLGTDVQIEGSLIIEAGVRIDFAAAGGFEVTAGTITVNGTESAPVTFNGGLGLALQSSGNSLSWLTIDGAGNGQYLLSPAAAALNIGTDSLPGGVTLDHVTLSNSAAYGLWAGPASTFTSTAITITGSAEAYAALNDYAQAGMLGGDATLSGGTDPVVEMLDYEALSTDTTFDFPTAPLRMSDDLKVETGATLTINGGTTLRFPASAGLIVTGTLVTAGTATDSVVLTADSGTAGGWAGVWIQSTSGNTLTHTTVSHGGADVFDFVSLDANVVVGSETLAGSVAFDTVSITDSAAFGISVVNTQSELNTSSVTFSNNASGDLPGAR